jgi:hypothetical protein
VAFLVKQFLSRASRPQIGGGEPVADKPRFEPRSETRHEAPRHEPRHDTRREPVRGERPTREEHAEPAVEAGNPKLFVSLGEADGLDANALKATLVELTGASADALTEIEIRRTSAYVRVAPADLDKVLAAHGKTFKDRPLVVEKARRRRR